MVSAFSTWTGISDIVQNKTRKQQFEIVIEILFDMMKTSVQSIPIQAYHKYDAMDISTFTI